MFYKHMKIITLPQICGHILEEAKQLVNSTLHLGTFA